MTEIWKDVKGFEGSYQVSNYGRVKSKQRVVPMKNGRTKTVNEKILVPIPHRGYLYVHIGTGKKLIHRLIATAFIPNPDNKPFVNHKDGNKSNNILSNLEWVTNQENMQHAFEHNLLQIGEKHHGSKVTEDIVRYIRTHYKSKDKEFGATALAKKFGLSFSHVRSIAKGEYWKHVK